MSDDETTIDREPFGRLVWDGEFWNGRVTLPGWAGFRPRFGPAADFGLVSDDGSAPFAVVPWEDEPPHDAQARAFAHLLRDETAVTRAVHEAILVRYPGFRERYGYGPAAAAELMPEVRTVDDLRPLIGLIMVHVVPTERHEMAYVGFEIECSWDEEAGLGVMTHAGRVLGVGPAGASWTVREGATPPPPRWWEFYG